MGVHNSQLTTNFLAKYQLSAIFLAYYQFFVIKPHWYPLSTTATLGTEESGRCREVLKKVNV